MNGAWMLVATIMTMSFESTLESRLQQSAVVIRGRVVASREVDLDRLPRSSSINPTVVQFEFPSTLREFDVIADHVLKGCVRRGERIRVWQGMVITGQSALSVSTRDTAVLFLRRSGEHYSAYHKISIRKGHPIDFQLDMGDLDHSPFTLQEFEAHLDSIIATQPGDSVLNDRSHNQTLHEDFGSITGQIVTRLDGKLRARSEIQVAMDNGRSVTTNVWGRFHLEGRAGTHILTFPGTALKPRKVRIPAGCFDFVQITAPQ